MASALTYGIILITNSQRVALSDREKKSVEYIETATAGRGLLPRWSSLAFLLNLINQVSLAEVNGLDVIWDRTCKTINTIVNWCHTKELSIRIRKRSLGSMKAETRIPLLNSAKFLDKVNFNEHIPNITKKATTECRLWLFAS